MILLGNLEAAIDGWCRAPLAQNMDRMAEELQYIAGEMTEYLDRTPISGDPARMARVRQVYEHLQAVCRWEKLGPQIGALETVRRVVARLGGLAASFDSAP